MEYSEAEAEDLKKNAEVLAPGVTSVYTGSTFHPPGGTVSGPQPLCPWPLSFSDQIPANPTNLCCASDLLPQTSF